MDKSEFDSFVLSCNRIGKNHSFSAATTLQVKESQELITMHQLHCSSGQLG